MVHHLAHLQIELGVFCVLVDAANIDGTEDRLAIGEHRIAEYVSI